MNKLELNTIYITYQGEANHFGIGAPVIFLRLQGCPIRCYAKTLGNLCDTPEGLERDENKAIAISSIVAKVNNIKAQTGIDLVCLTGGDPLWHHKDKLTELFTGLKERGLKVSVETSGVISVKPYLEFSNMYWVIDYKLISAGVDAPFHKDNYNLPEDTIVKMVIYDQVDLEQAIKVVTSNVFPEHVKFVFGLYWGTSRLTYEDLTTVLMENNLLGKCSVNFQAHKLAEFYDQNSELACHTKVRREI